MDDSHLDRHQNHVSESAAAGVESTGMRIKMLQEVIRETGERKAQLLHKVRSLLMLQKALKRNLEEEVAKETLSSKPLENDTNEQDAFHEKTDDSKLEKQPCCNNNIAGCAKEISEYTFKSIV